MRRLLLPALLLASLLPGVAARLPAQQTREAEITDLDFTGNHAFSGSELRTAIVTEQSHCRNVLLQPFCWINDWGFAVDKVYLSSAELPEDVLRLKLYYRRRGYRDVQVDTAIARSGDDVSITFRIDEGPPTIVDSLGIRGVEGVLDTTELRKSFPLHAGDPFDLVALSRGEQQITTELQNRGYLHATVLHDYFLPKGERTARVSLDVDPGTRVRISEVRVEGAKGIGEKVVRQFLTFAPGQYYDQRKINESQRNLYGLSAVRFANIQTEAADDSAVVVDVSVQEARPRTVRTGIGAATTDCLVTETTFTHRNFLGGARRLQVTGRLSNILAKDLGGTFPCTDVGQSAVFRKLNYRLRVEVQQPYFFSGKNSLRGALFLERESVPDIFVRDSKGGEIALTRQLRRRMPLTLSYRPDFTSFDAQSADVFFCVNYGFCTPEDIRNIVQPRWLSPVALSWRYDHTNAAFSPTSGYYVTVDAERASKLTGSNYHYYRASLEAADFERVSGDHIVAAFHIRTGFVQPTGGNPTAMGVGGEEEVVHPRKRFFEGGPQSVRGYGFNLLGPTVLVLDSASYFGCGGSASCVQALPPPDFQQRPRGGNAAFEASVELRIRIGANWSTVAFVDGGQVLRDIGVWKAPVVTPGIGVRYFSPVGPLRLDFGYNPAGAQRLPVVVEHPSGKIEEPPGLTYRYDPFTYDSPGALKEFLRRIQVQISIGEAF